MSAGRRVRRAWHAAIWYGAFLALGVPVARAAQPEPVEFLFAPHEPQGVAVVPGTRPYLLVALGKAGLAALDGNGTETHRIPAADHGEFSAVAAGAPWSASEQVIHPVIVADQTNGRILVLEFDTSAGKFRDVPATSGAPAGTAAPTPEHLCLATGTLDEDRYVFSGGEHGLLVQHRLVMTTAGSVSLQPVRTIPIGGETSACSADDVSGLVFVVEPGFGLWRVPVDPESEPVREPVAAVKPLGTLDEPVAVAMIRDASLMHPLLADARAGAFIRLDEIAEGTTTAGMRAPFPDLVGMGSLEDLVVARFPLASKDTDVLVMAIEDETGGGRVLVTPAGSLGAAPAAPAAAREQEIAAVQPLRETEAVATGGDAADDPAIWVHPTDAALSLVLGTDKKRGLGVHDLSGKLLQFLPDGRLNNVDVRPAFADSGGPAYLAAATDRTHIAIALYGIDPQTRRVVRVDAHPVPAEFHDPYGLCLYRDPATRSLYAIATSSDGMLHQWRLVPDGKGKVSAEIVRRIRVGTVAEGCVADDESGHLFVTEEGEGIWRYGAHPDAGDERIKVAGVRPDGELVADVEGIAIHAGTDGNGWLVVSSQGSDAYAVYERRPPHRFRGMFRIRANPGLGLDGASETDGLDVTSAPLPGLPAGLLVVQDGRNVEPPGAQNFKYVSWHDVATSLGLD